MADKEKELTVEKILKDFKTAYNAKSKWIKAAKADLEFTYGDQWDAEDVAKLNARGVKPLSINKIKPKIQLITGIESQNRSDITCYPEGGEDNLKGEITTGLVKNVMKQSQADYKVSEQFELGLNTGEGFIEPYIDYTNDLINGELKFRVRDYDAVFYDPNSHEYDLSDAKYLTVLTQKLTDDDLIAMFPGQEKLIKGGTLGRIEVDSVSNEVLTAPSTNYNNTKGSVKDNDDADAPYDLLEYYYKKMVKAVYVADRKLGKLTEAANDEIADKYVEIGNAEAPDSARKIVRYVPEIWKVAISGKAKLDQRKMWVYPGWKGYHIIPFFCFRAPGKLSKLEYAVQGLPRGLKDLNIELNKRRTQELHILNTSANSGWQAEEGALTPAQEKAYAEFGSAPGIILKHQKGYAKPEKITPTPLSQGHAQLAAENSQDIKEASGINDDLLSMGENQASGRAIMLRQKQGLVQIQKIFDNLSQTKRILGRFVLSQLGKVYDVETAMRVMGEEFCTTNFVKPVMAPMINPVSGQPVPDPTTGQPAMGPQMDPGTGQPVTQYDEPSCKAYFNSVLMDAELGKYDVAVGEGASSETVKFANFMTLKELAQAGIPIPPEVIVEDSSLSQVSKEKIKAAIAQQQQAAAMGAGMPPPPPTKK